MNEKILLTSANFIKSNSNISDNISDKFLQSAIRESQDFTIQSIIGSALYNKIKQLISDNTIKDEVNAIYKGVLDIIQYAMLYDVMSKLCIITSVKLDNTGAYQTNDVNVQSVSLKDAFSMQDYYTNKMNFYIKRLQMYCIENKSDLKELSENKCTEMHSNIYSSASTSVWLGGARGKGRFAKKGCHHC